MNLTHIDLFCGCGGLGLGFENAGFETLLAIDINKDAVKTYNHNLKDVAVVDYIENFPFPYFEKVNVITAGFPCQPFSTAGLQKGFEDDRSSYYNKLLEVYDFYKPDFIIMENVKGFTFHNKGESFRRVVEDLTNLGYTVKHKVLNSWFYDVPQKRERVIIVATNNDLSVDYKYPKEKESRLVLKDCLKDCDTFGFEWSDYKKEIYKAIPEGGCIGKNYYKRLSMNEPSPTLTTTPVGKLTSKCHPTELRPISIMESQVIQSFPKTFKFFGSRSSQYKQIGNAVPVNLAYNIALSIKDCYNEVS